MALDAALSFLRRLSNRLPGTQRSQAAFVAGAIAVVAGAVAWWWRQRQARVAQLGRSVVLITGASQGIGAATARLLAKVRV